MILPILNKQINRAVVPAMGLMTREGTCGGQHKFNSLPDMKQDETYHLLMAVTLILCPQGCLSFLIFSAVPKQTWHGTLSSGEPCLQPFLWPVAGRASLSHSIYSSVHMVIE